MADIAVVAPPAKKLCKGAGLFEALREVQASAEPAPAPVNAAQARTQGAFVDKESNGNHRENVSGFVRK